MYQASTKENILHLVKFQQLSFTYFEIFQFHVTYLLNTTIIVFRFLKGPLIQNFTSDLILSAVHSPFSLDEKECAGKHIYTL